MTLMAVLLLVVNRVGYLVFLLLFSSCEFCFSFSSLASQKMKLVRLCFSTVSFTQKIKGKNALLITG